MNPKHEDFSRATPKIEMSTVDEIWPQLVNEFGTKVWYNKKGQEHRLDGPAIEYRDGGKDWYKNGKRHRCSGPAIVWSSEYRDWFIDGQRLTENEFYSHSECTIKKRRCPKIGKVSPEDISKFISHSDCTISKEPTNEP